ncbi:NB-ARC domain-containing disease resistance protein [Actinidia rufa]|uniref:NB-ARC domain-containing disease resistance protein n=1 Tax=Actinidia rufa TaxID=165716 RepID=A0A7J0F0H4_9ERIC|nr:NB-ARC domain-containing disease resistance protein [Actinidia rufa]
MAEALVGGAFLSATLQVLFDRLASPEVVKLFRGPKRIDGDKLLQNLKLSLLGMKPVLEDAEKKQITDQSVQEWLDELKHVVFQADDLVDEIATEALRLKVESQDKSGLNQVRAPISTSPSLLDAEFVSKIEEIVDSLEYFAKQKDVLGLKEVASRRCSHRLPSTSLVVESDVYGRDDNKEEIIKLLVSNEQSGSEIDVIPIVGMGGVGKTTLASTWLQRQFLRKSLQVISDTQNLNQLQVRLKESLRGKKFLIVLDDVWNVNPGHWDNLRAPFMVGACGSKIIATTRHHGVASLMQTVPVHHLQQVSDEDCWSLFAKIAFYNEDFRDHPELGKIGREIVIQRCKGLPLAAKILAGLLRSTRDVEEWDNILTSELWDLSSNDILPVLRLSYNYLPSRLKQCFAFCSLFPKDYEFEKKELVLLWIAQDFVHQPKGNKTLEKVGDEFFHELLSRSFFQQASGSKSSFVMHDLIHDLAQVVSGQFIVRLDQEKLHDISIKVRHVSYVRDKYYGLGIFRAIENAKHLRTFLQRKPPINLIGDFIRNRVLDDILSTLRCSRVLSLSWYKIMELPISIGNLIHLRYLDLSRTNIKQLPEIVCTLYNLQTLLLSNCSFLTTLPEDIGKLVCLRYLAINGTNLTKMPMQMGRLRGLQHLTNFVVGKCSGSGINELKEFYHLRGKLSLSSLQNVIGGKDAFEANLKEKKHLEELVLKWGNTTDDSHNEREVLEKLQPHTNLNCLTIENYGGTRFPDWLGNKSYSKIVVLVLNECNYCSSLPPLGQLPSLKWLVIARMNGITRVGQEFYGDGSSIKPFQSLETLHFEEMSEWVDWQIFGNGEFSQLRKLWIIKCPKLVGGLPENIPSWVTLEIRECSGLMASLPRSCAARKLILAGCDGVGLGWQEQMEICYTSLERLELDRCDCLTRLPLDFFPKLGTLFICSCKNFETLSIVDGHGLQSLTSLQSVRIMDCRSMVSFPKGGLPAPNLRLFELESCLKLQVLPEQMQTLFPSLESLALRNCPEIESFPDGGLPYNLRKLHIFNCKKLVDRRREWGLQRLPSLRDFELGDALNSDPCLKRGFQPPSNTCVFGAALNSDPCLKKGLPASLETLRIANCPQLQALPEKGLPPSLSLLEIKSCLLLKPRCQRDRGDDWHKIAHITCVVIDWEMIS